MIDSNARISPRATVELRAAAAEINRGRHQCDKTRARQMCCVRVSACARRDSAQIMIAHARTNICIYKLAIVFRVTRARGRERWRRRFSR